LWMSFKSLSYRLWDENAQEMVSFRKLRIRQSGLKQVPVDI
jgi:hypothetical protein